MLSILDSICSGRAIGEKLWRLAKGKVIHDGLIKCL